MIEKKRGTGTTWKNEEASGTFPKLLLDVTPSMTIALQVSYKGTTHSLVVDALDTVASLKERIAELTAVPVGYQKLMHKAFHIASEASLLSSLFAQGTHKILLVGSTASDVAIIQNKDAFMTRRRGNFSQAGSKITEKAALRQFTFGAIKPLEGLPNSDPARRLLIRIREDVGIIEVMRKHHWYVHTLTEMPPVAPTEEGKLLGFNKNAGEEISLRLRTDDMSGFRHYRTIISTVLHELVHMEIGPHNDDFHALNRILNKEYDSFSTGRTTGVEGRVDGSQYFTVEGEAIRDSSASYQGGAFVLGGTGSSSSFSNVGGSPSTNDAAAQREARLAAIERRLKRWEQDQVNECEGTGKKK